MKTIYKDTWSLNTIFPHGPKGKDFKAFKTNLEKLFDDFENNLSKKNLHRATLASEKLFSALSTLSAYSICLFSENVTNKESQSLQGLFRQLETRYNKLLIEYDLLLKNLNEKNKKAFLEDDEIKPIAFYIKERLFEAKYLLTLAEERLICDLSIDGYHGFSQTFDTLHSRLKFSLGKELLSYPEIENKLCDKNKTKRDQAFESFTKTFSEQKEVFAELLNHIAGFRLKVYEKRGWDNPLFEPLKNNRIDEKILSSMMSTISENLKPLRKYLTRKAKLLTLDKLSWTDVDAPLGKTTSSLTFDKACELIIKSFKPYSKKLADFSEKALKSAWIDAETRKNKAAGGFCIGFPESKESRIFMSFDGSPTSVSTLAHELGHGYHNEIIFDLPVFSQQFKMNIAETASTMCEMIVSDALYQKAKTKDERIHALDEKLSRAVAFCMNLVARFEFEKAFYKKRPKGFVDAETLSSLMEKAQKQAYGDSLNTYHPLFWASKLHFYFTDEPFYNFPYTFGYLLSLGFYELYKDKPKRFEKTFDGFLQDSGSMSTEKLIKKHLDYTLHDYTFWSLGMKSIEDDVKEFLTLTEAQP